MLRGLVFLACAQKGHFDQTDIAADVSLINQL